MGLNGCGWVRWDAGGMRDSKARQGGDIYGLAGPDLGPMAGEISPDIMVLRVCRIWVLMGV